MTGDGEDILRRLRLTLPVHWFGDVAPVLDALLSGLSGAWSALYTLLDFVKTQSRVGSATGDFLDLAATDFFGADFARRYQESDPSLRPRLLRAMRRERATRAALVDAALEAGFTAKVFEPAQPYDTGAYNVSAGLAWNIAGGWGSLQMPLECLVTATRGTAAYDAELWQGVGEAMPAGGVAWMRVTG